MTVRLGGVVITNPSKPLWPAEGLTKLDLAQFYSRIASQILPWLKSRPLALERCPDCAREQRSGEPGAHRLDTEWIGTRRISMRRLRRRPSSSVLAA